MTFLFMSLMYGFDKKLRVRWTNYAAFGRDKWRNGYWQIKWYLYVEFGFTFYYILFSLG